MKQEHWLWAVAIVLVGVFVWFHKTKVCVDAQGTPTTHSWLWPCGANSQSITV